MGRKVCGQGGGGEGSEGALGAQRSVFLTAEPSPLGTPLRAPGYRGVTHRGFPTQALGARAEAACNVWY